MLRLVSIIIFLTAIVPLSGCYPEPKVTPVELTTERVEYLNSIEGGPRRRGATTLSLIHI